MPLDACMGCGRPAYKLWPPNQRPILRYCGQEECFNNLVAIHKTPSGVAPRIVPAGPGPVVLAGFVPRGFVPQHSELVKAIGAANARIDQRSELRKVVERKLKEIRGSDNEIMRPIL